MGIALKISAVFAAALLAAQPTAAHDDRTLDATRAPHGGQLRMAGPHHFELVIDGGATVASESAVVVYLYDHAEAKVQSAGATGSATILSGKGKTVVTLVPDGENRMKGAGRYASTPDMKVAVTITLPGQPSAQARFTPGQRARH